MGRKLFGTDGIRGVPNKEPLTLENILELGRAIAYIFKDFNNDTEQNIVIGYDTRLSCPMIESALAAGIISMGANVLSTGVLPTPAIAFITNDMRADAGIVISASHNPYTDNGIKIFDAMGYKLSDELEKKIEEVMFTDVLKNNLSSPDKIGQIRDISDAKSRYIVFAKKSFPKELSLKGIRIVLDCANGAAYKVAQNIFKELGAELFFVDITPNGTNINDECGALYPENISEKVKKYRADIGISLDGDADRVILIDENGAIIDGDYIMAMIAINMKANKTLNKNTIVTTPMSNLGLKKALEKYDISVVEAEVGDRYVVNSMKEHKFNFGGEQSGHMIFLDHTTTGDGIIAALQVLSFMIEKNKPLSELIQVMEKYPQILRNIKVNKKTPFQELPKFFKRYKEIEAELIDSGRIFIRYSGTESLARIMMEADDKNKIEKYADELENLLLES